MDDQEFPREIRKGIRDIETILNEIRECDDRTRLHIDAAMFKLNSLWDLVSHSPELRPQWSIYHEMFREHFGDKGLNSSIVSPGSG